MRAVIFIILITLFSSSVMQTAENSASDNNRAGEQEQTENNNRSGEQAQADNNNRSSEQTQTNNIDRNINPVQILREWVVHLKNKNWQKVAVFFGYRFNAFLNEAYSLFKDKPEKMKKFLIRQGIKNPQKTSFVSAPEMALTIFQESERFKGFFQDVLKPFIKITIDYYNKPAGTIYERIDSQFYVTLNYTFVRKLKIYPASDRIFYIRRDIKGWFIDIGNI